MWISKRKYDDLLRRFLTIEECIVRDAKRIEEMRLLVMQSRDMHSALVTTLGLSYAEIPAKREYIKKGGPERG